MTSIATVTKTSARSRGPANTTNAIVPMSSPSRNGIAKSVRPTELGRLKVCFPDVPADRPRHDPDRAYECPQPQRSREQRAPDRPRNAEGVFSRCTCRSSAPRRDDLCNKRCDPERPYPQPDRHEQEPENLLGLRRSQQAGSDDACDGEGDPGRRVAEVRDEVPLAGRRSQGLLKGLADSLNAVVGTLPEDKPRLRAAFEQFLQEFGLVGEQAGWYRAGGVDGEGAILIL